MEGTTTGGCDDNHDCERRIRVYVIDDEILAAEVKSLIGGDTAP
jgi:hypothetical protein